MSGLKQTVDGLSLQKLEVAYRPPQLYLVAGSPYTIFIISGGPVWIKALFAHTIEAVAAATTFAITISGTAVDSGAIAIASAINRLIVSPLDETIARPIVRNVAVSSAVAGGFMLMAVPGNISLAVAVADTDGTMAWYCAYYRMNPAALVAP